jgi:hypothetical protein
VDPAPRPLSASALLGVLAIAGVALVVGAGVLLAAWSVAGTSTPDASVAVGASSAPSAAIEEEGWAPWDRNDDGRPVRWDPCTPIDLVVAPEGAYPGFEADLEDALDELQELTGLTIRVVAEVDERPDARRPLYQPERYGDRWAPVLVAFAHPHEGELPLLDVDHGLAAPVAVGPRGARVYVSGQVVFNHERDDLRPGEDDRDGSWGATLRHELGHLLGLAHVDDERELMYPHPTPGPVRWGEGDRRGLAALSDGGCLELPEAQPLEVEVGPAR